MNYIKQLEPSDLFNLDLINLDKFSESFHFDYYLFYLLNHSEDCFCIFKDNKPVGYILSKLERKNNINSNHLSAISIAPAFRRFHFGSALMNIFENNGNFYFCKFADLFVRKNNISAINFYTKLGYNVYRVVKKYYNDEEDAYDMRKSLMHDKEKEFSKRGCDIHCNDLD
ncbi:n-acetyltransferase 5 [Vairimorpha apis BRL 01]|uniref:N-acetyltransferase 5 n=1 Tax=Vairimorpha apis BRL 01 TaxID=1037528 RepID=T0MFH6_9MICR|nr:n-acetyltransferase 5 [Vairimorpha apis BRL 01]